VFLEQFEIECMEATRGSLETSPPSATIIVHAVKSRCTGIANDSATKAMGIKRGPQEYPASERGWVLHSRDQALYLAGTCLASKTSGA
jgi:hypothetical protein